jgi:hypothetical protein
VKYIVSVRVSVSRLSGSNVCGEEHYHSSKAGSKRIQG